MCVCIPTNPFQSGLVIDRVIHQRNTRAMARGRPTFIVRMDPEDVKHLRDVARAYGAPNASAFVREMFQAMLSPDVATRLSYVHHLSVKLGEQLTLPLHENAAKPKKRRRGRGRTT